MYSVRSSTKGEENFIPNSKILSMTADSNVSYSAMSFVMEHMYLGSRESLQKAGNGGK